MFSTPQRQPLSTLLILILLTSISLNNLLYFAVLVFFSISILGILCWLSDVEVEDLGLFHHPAIPMDHTYSYHLKVLLLVMTRLVQRFYLILGQVVYTVTTPLPPLPHVTLSFSFVFVNLFLISPQTLVICGFYYVQSY